MSPSTTSSKTRDAQRSREAILDAAESLFAQHGYDGTALGEVAAAARLSRGTPSYFFGAKADLYEAVLERAFAEREEAVISACEPLSRWAQREGDPKALRRALGTMVKEYLAFLLAHPQFVRLMVWESLQGGQRLHGAPHESRAIEAAFGAVRDSVRSRRLGTFAVDDAVLLTLGLTFGVVANRDTYVTKVRMDLDDQTRLRRHVRLVVDQLLALVLR